MKQRKLRGYVLPTLYVIILMLIFGTVSVVSTLMQSKPDYLYATGILKNDVVMPVVRTDGALSETIIKPYSSDGVVVDKYFYDMNDEEEKQKNSLIFFKDTYMKNTGILYKSDAEFPALMVLDGTVANIKNDEILGNVVEIEHSNNLRTTYYSLDKIEIKVGDFLNQGDVVGISGVNNISDSKYNLLFEVNYNGTLIDPEDFYELNPSELN
ncbi:MAG: M23 family metallopeptidase [Ruminococcus sp.]|nr:M23 family metallopeptidase [Ruminococcus sp.]